MKIIMIIKSFFKILKDTIKHCIDVWKDLSRWEKFFNELKIAEKKEKKAGGKLKNKINIPKFVEKLNFKITIRTESININMKYYDTLYFINILIDRYYKLILKKIKQYCIDNSKDENFCIKIMPEYENNDINYIEILKKLSKPSKALKKILKKLNIKP